LQSGPIAPRSVVQSQKALIAAGEDATLGALLLCLTCPGIPDIYQGDETWALELVDPDNRRPVDWSDGRGALTPR
jgi:(1->4)-alpha-D-glucan 1-alpha-D-glucosylmutase